MNLVKNILHTESEDVLYSNSRFSRVRKKYADQGELEAIIQIDSSKSYNIKCISYTIPQLEKFTIESVVKTDPLPGYIGNTFIEGWKLWIPRDPTVREYDGKNIVDENKTTVEFSQTEECVTVIPKNTDSGRVEIPGVLVPESEDYLAELLDPVPVETEPVTKAFWFDYDGIGSLWDYLIDGNIYDPRSESNGRWKCQQCAHTLALHLLELGKQTQKNIYYALSELISYTVAIDLPDDGRWRHGAWTLRDETHTRFQTDGIHLLISYYIITNDELFYNTAVRGMDWLLSVSEAFSGGGIWLLHDTLEMSVDHNQNHYENISPSEILGKSRMNTLCLNTHVWTMSALYRISKISSRSHYREAFDEATKGLHRVLSLNSATLLYRNIDKIFDLIEYNELFPEVISGVEKRLSREIFSLLKKKYPRLVMPSGRIDRDLTATVRSDFYHLQNLKDLLILNSYIGDDIIESAIKSGVDYILKSGLIKKMSKSDRRVVMIIDILMLSEIQLDKDYSPQLEKYFDFLEERGLYMSSDAISLAPLLDDSCLDSYRTLQENHVFPRINSNFHSQKI